jgi:hypothetical protein
METRERKADLLARNKATQSEQSRVTLRLTVSQSVSMSWCRAHSGLVIRYYFPSESL